MIENEQDKEYKVFNTKGELWYFGLTQYIAQEENEHEALVYITSTCDVKQLLKLINKGYNK